MNNLSNVDTIKQLLERFDGNHSQLYPKIKDRLVRYEPEELTFPDEFLCFEADYMMYKLHMIENRLPHKEVVDIGCQYGFQACLFEDYSYTGIDSYDSRKFFEPEKNSYIVGAFPNIEIDLKGKIVISNMSLGYFNNDKKGVTNETIAEKLKEAEYLYIATTSDLYEILRQSFKRDEIICDRHPGFTRRFLSKH